MNWLWLYRVGVFYVSCNDPFEQQRTFSYPNLFLEWYPEGRTVGTVRKLSLGTGREKGPFVQQQRQNPTCLFSHTDKGGRGTFIFSGFLIFFQGLQHKIPSRKINKEEASCMDRKHQNSPRRDTTVSYVRSKGHDFARKKCGEDRVVGRGSGNQRFCIQQATGVFCRTGCSWHVCKSWSASDIAQKAETVWKASRFVILYIGCRAVTRAQVCLSLCNWTSPHSQCLCYCSLIPLPACFARSPMPTPAVAGANGSSTPGS